MSATRLSNQKQSTYAFIDAWKRLSADDMVKLRTPNCVQQALPLTLKVPEQTNEDFAAFIKPQFGLLSNFKVTVHSITHDAEAGRTVLYADTAADAKWGDYRNTHIQIFTWNDDGTRMTRLDDMMDSAGLMERMKLMEAWQAKQPK